MYGTQLKRKFFSSLLHITYKTYTHTTHTHTHVTHIIHIVVLRCRIVVFKCTSLCYYTYVHFFLTQYMCIYTMSHLQMSTNHVSGSRVGIALLTKHMFYGVVLACIITYFILSSAQFTLHS